MTDEHRGVPEHVLRAGAAAAASPGLLAAIQAADRAASMPDPSRGQLWRASWDDVTQLVIVLRVTAVGSATVVPVTVDPPASDEASVVADAALTLLGHEATLWGGFAADIPFLVFDVLLGVVAPTIVAAAERAAVGEGSDELPEGLRAGSHVESPFDPAAQVRAELSDALDLLRHAAWATPSAPAGKPLPELLKGRNDVPALLRKIAETLGLKPPEVMSIMKGARPVLPDQAPVFARITGLTEQEVLSAAPPLPDDLILELDRPKWRKALTARRASAGSEGAARRSVAYGALALAARQTGASSADPWPERIRQYLATHPTGGNGQ
jgi:DNA-binding transcriptional regulator YdaS (Cro superfamily)